MYSSIRTWTYAELCERAPRRSFPICIGNLLREGFVSLSHYLGVLQMQWCDLKKKKKFLPHTRNITQHRCVFVHTLSLKFCHVVTWGITVTRSAVGQYLSPTTTPSQRHFVLSCFRLFSCSIHLSVKLSLSNFPKCFRPTRQIPDRRTVKYYWWTLGNATGEEAEGSRGASGVCGL